MNCTTLGTSLSNFFIHYRVLYHHIFHAVQWVYKLAHLYLLLIFFEYEPHYANLLEKRTS